LQAHWCSLWLPSGWIRSNNWSTIDIEVLMLRRTSFDVIVDILDSAKGGACKTRIVYGANLNFEIVKQYLQDLTQKGMLAVNEQGKYVTTKKGYKFIEDYSKLIQPLQF